MHLSELKVPASSSFNQILEPEQNLSQENIGYLPPITDVINQTLSIKKELGLSYIFLEVDQGIYTKILDVMCKLDNENNKIFDKNLFA